MSYSAEDWRLAVTNLLKQTSKKEVSWTASDLFRGDAWMEVDHSLQCTIGNKNYVVTQGRRKMSYDGEEYFWREVHSFNVFKKNVGGEKIATAPEDLSIIRNLYDAAEKSYAFESDALADLL